LLTILTQIDSQSRNVSQLFDEQTNEHVSWLALARDQSAGLLPTQSESRFRIPAESLMVVRIGCHWCKVVLRFTHGAIEMKLSDWADLAEIVGAVAIVAPVE